LCVHALGCSGSDRATVSEAVEDQNEQPATAGIHVELARIAQIEEPVVEDTKRARNEQLGPLFDEWAEQRTGEPPAQTIKEFNRMLKKHGLTSFDDFLVAETTPLRHVPDPASGDSVSVFGPLGSDVINPWLAAVEVIDGKPLDEQPNYHLACDALREHIDFALIGRVDPNLSLELLPLGLRENAKWAYRRLNPTNKFDGGFDQGLFYATIREAAKKLFREDHPQAKLTMADVVVPEERGGFGIGSCLLCHDRSHSGIYKRLLGQHLYLEQKAAELLEDGAGAPQVQEEIDQLGVKAAVFLRAAEVVSVSFPKEIDVDEVRASLRTASVQDTARLKPGYDEFSGTLDELGCIECHSMGSKVPADRNPATYEAFSLHSSAYYKTRNIRALLALVDMGDLTASELVRKATGEVAHGGPDLGPEESRSLSLALSRWIEAGQ